MARILSVSTAVQDKRYDHREIKELCLGIFGPLLAKGQYSFALNAVSEPS
jgi:hypothetical protein